MNSTMSRRRSSVSIFATNEPGLFMRSASATDGMSLLSPLASGVPKSRESFWKFQGHRQRAARRGQWKYNRFGENEFLYDLSSDTMERANRAKAEPAILKQLTDAWTVWNEGMAPDNDMPGYCENPANVGTPYAFGGDANCKPPRG